LTGLVILDCATIVSRQTIPLEIFFAEAEKSEEVGSEGDDAHPNYF
jgi:hypothetical protein